ncbi:hypothetical protein [Streptomyces sp. NPDC126499]|uniref:hypothetical protein n=1 Tax=Streptomyces sp. NPDC126499 TaxID=3155314 RepID=UPI00331BF57D
MGAIAFSAISCTTTEPPSQAKDRLCEISEGSAEEALLHRTLAARSYDTEWLHRDRDFSERMQDMLRHSSTPSTPRVESCGFAPRDQQSNARDVVIHFSWTPRVDPSKHPRLKERTYYELGNSFGESSDAFTELRTPCTIPGDLRTKSEERFLHAKATYSADLDAAPDTTMRNEQVSFLYLMARRATNALGCEGNPLKADPVAKPIATSSHTSAPEGTKR